MNETSDASQDGEARVTRPLPKGEAPWGTRPRKRLPRPPVMAPWKITALVIVAAFGMIAVSLGQQQIKWHADRLRGEALQAGQVIEGESGLYTLTLPDDSWVRVGTDMIHEGTDLSLFGSHEDHYVLSYVRCNDDSINAQVEFRRERQRGSLRALAITEERSLIPDSGLPVSYALYAGKKKGFGSDKVSWVATIAKDEFLVEVIGSAGGDPEELAAVKRVVESLEIKEEASACAS